MFELQMELVAVFTVNRALGIDEKAQSAIKLYPNPVNDLLTIELPQISVQGISIADASGRVISERFVSGSQGMYNVSTETLARGSYFLYIKTKDGSRLVKRFVKL